MTSSHATSSKLPLINKLVVVGVGLIGGSLAKGLKARGVCREVIGIALSEEICAQAKSLAIVDRAYTSLAAVAGELTGEDLIFIAVPTLAVESVLQQIQDGVAATVTITDGASVKGSVQRSAEQVFGQVPAQFVLGHPIAGSERSGVTAANPDLYENHRCILTPLASTDPQHLQRVTRMWQSLGAEVLSMSVAEHDEVLGATSHLPHAIAYSLVDTLAHDINNPNIFRYAAGGFRDFTRIASSDPLMWHDIMRANKEGVLHALDLFIANLTRLRSGIEREDSQYLLEVFTRAKGVRDEFTAKYPKKSAAATSPLTYAAGRDGVYLCGRRARGRARPLMGIKSGRFVELAPSGRQCRPSLASAKRAPASKPTDQES